MAEDVEPSSVNLALTPIPMGEFDDDLGFDSETPVLTRLYTAETGQFVDAVFGVGLGTPVGRGRARFLTYPQGPFELTERGGLVAMVPLAVPPWERRTLAAFDHVGRKLELAILDAESSQEGLDWAGCIPLPGATGPCAVVARLGRLSQVIEVGQLLHGFSELRLREIAAGASVLDNGVAEEEPNEAAYARGGSSFDGVVDASGQLFRD